MEKVDPTGKAQVILEAVVYTFIVASEKKNTRGGVQFEILRNPGIDFYSGSRDPKKSRYRLL